jgi:hypothetical protein
VVFVSLPNYLFLYFDETVEEEAVGGKKKTDMNFYYHLDSLHDMTLVARCGTGQYCCYSHFLEDCCDGEGYQFSLSNHNPSAKNKTDVTKRVTIGAAVGGALGGLAMIGGAVGVWLYLRKKKVKQEEEVIAQDEISGPPEMKQVLEMGADSVTGQKCTAEADMKDHPTVVEMDSTVVYELGA